MVYSCRTSEAVKTCGREHRDQAHEEALDRYRRVRSIAISQSGVPVDWKRGSKRWMSVKPSDEEIIRCKAEWRMLHAAMVKAAGRAATDAVDTFCDQHRQIKEVDDCLFEKALSVLAQYYKTY